jgi:uncharacterized protein (TIGR03083 family)
MADVVALINTEADQLQDFMASLAPEEWSRLSACTGWTVGDVVAHLTQGAQTWSDTITRAVAGDSTPPPGQRFLQAGERGSEVTAQRAIAFRSDRTEAALLQAFADGYQRLHQVLLGLQPEDWEKPCFHRRGALLMREYVGRRLQELAIHGWDMRVAFDTSATVSEPPLPLLVSLAQRWLANTFRPVPSLSAPVRYRFDVSRPVPVRQDVLVTQEGFHVESVTNTDADVTFSGTTGDYMLLVYGRLPLDQAIHTGRLEVAGDRQQASLFSTLFLGI